MTAVVIGFKNPLEAVVEGRATTLTVCAEVKPEGLGLDPFDRVSLTIRTNPGLYNIFPQVPYNNNILFSS